MMPLLGKLLHQTLGPGHWVVGMPVSSGSPSVSWYQTWRTKCSAPAIHLAKLARRGTRFTASMVAATSTYSARTSGLRVLRSTMLVTPARARTLA